MYVMEHAYVFKSSNFGEVVNTKNEDEFVHVLIPYLGITNEDEPYCWNGILHDLSIMSGDEFNYVKEKDPSVPTYTLPI